VRLARLGSRLPELRGPQVKSVPPVQQGKSVKQDLLDKQLPVPKDRRALSAQRVPRVPSAQRELSDKRDPRAPEVLPVQPALPVLRASRDKSVPPVRPARKVRQGLQGRLDLPVRKVPPEPLGVPLGRRVRRAQPVRPEVP